jgi:hypothetical protein
MGRCGPAEGVEDSEDVTVRYTLYSFPFSTFLSLIILTFFLSFHFLSRPVNS